MDNLWLNLETSTFKRLDVADIPGAALACSAKERSEEAIKEGAAGDPSHREDEESAIGGEDAACLGQRLGVDDVFGREGGGDLVEMAGGVRKVLGVGGDETGGQICGAQTMVY